MEEKRKALTQKGMKSKTRSQKTRIVPAVRVDQIAY
jgi:hypothetical protein